MWVKPCHEPPKTGMVSIPTIKMVIPIWEWFIQPIYGDLGDGLWHCSNHMTVVSPISGDVIFDV